ncbi:MAG: hypothetical protein N4A71_23645 [Carboxylicivirga sp.]|jgi:uncharacterized protein YcfL|nr:hypothetical protein [Carboxylicivirga sp.]
MKQLLLFAVITLMTVSCAEDEYQAIGDWDDNIHLSTKSVEIGPGAESTTITTKGDGWWINHIKVNGKPYFYDHEMVDMSQATYKITEDTFTFERKNNTTMIISLPANTSGKMVKMDISLQSGNYFDYVYVTQAAQ